MGWKGNIISFVALKGVCCVGLILDPGGAQFFVGISTWLMSGWGLAMGAALSTLALIVPAPLGQRKIRARLSSDIARPQATPRDLS